MKPARCLFVIFVYTLLLSLMTSCTGEMERFDDNGSDGIEDVSEGEDGDVGQNEEEEGDIGEVDGGTQDLEDVSEQSDGEDTDPAPADADGELATVLTYSVESITASSALSNGHVATNGGTPVTERGFCWGIDPMPDIDQESCSVDGAGTGDITGDLQPLLAATTYHVRAYATNAVGTAYGAPKTFETLAEEPIDPENTMEILILFLEWNAELGVVAMSTPVDVKINDTWYYFHGLGPDSPEWDIAYGATTARGKIITIEAPIVDIDFNLDQIVDPGLNNHGFGAFHIKMSDRHPDTDFSLGLHNDDEDDLNYLSSSYTRGGYWSRTGFNLNYHDNPWFPHFVFDGFDPDTPWGPMDDSWSESGKFLLRIAGQGWDHLNPYYE